MRLIYTVNPDRFVAGGAGEVSAPINLAYLPKNVIAGNSSKSWSTEVVQASVYGIERTHQIKTGLIRIEDLDKWREYEESTLGTEVHTFDPYWVSGADVNPVSVYREFRSWNQEVRGAKFFSLSFTLIETQ